MPRPEIKELNRNYGEIIRRLDGLTGHRRTRTAAKYKSKDELLAEKGRIEHWLWMLESE